METIVVSKTINAAVADVWASWDEFGDIYRFNPNVASSRLLSDTNAPTGIGTRRECELVDGKNWLRERVVEYLAMRRLGFDVYESSLPVKSMRATVEFTETDDGGTDVRMSTGFEPHAGFLGKLLVPVMRRRFRPMLEALLDGNAAYVEQEQYARRAA